jgi:uncharacterized protein (TIGR02466 family)
MEHKLNYNVYSLFAVPLFECELQVNDEVIEYVNTLEYRRTGAENSNISTSMDVLENEKLSFYSDQIDACAKTFVYDIIKYDEKFMNIERVSSWVNKHNPGDWAHTHMHYNSFISGVWYLETSDNCGDLEVSTSYNVFGSPMVYRISESNRFNKYSWDFPAIKNKLYIFPSVLNHSVHKNKSSQVRTSIAFNYYARGKVFSESNLIDS